MCHAYGKVPLLECETQCPAAQIKRRNTEQLEQQQYSLMVAASGRSDMQTVVASPDHSRVKLAVNHAAALRNPGEIWQLLIADTLPFCRC